MSMGHDRLKGDLTTGRVTSHLVRLTVPMIWGLLAIISFQLADMYFIAKLGPLPLVAIGFTFPVTMVILSLIIAMGISTSSIVSRQIGTGGGDSVQRLSTHALMIAGIAGILFAVIGIATIDPVFRAMGANDSVLPLIRQFMVILYAGTAFQAVMMVGNSILRASGDTLSPALILMTCAILNIMLDPVLIFGLFGCPRLEMRGAAIANVIAFIIAMAGALYVLGIRNRFVARAHLNFAGFKDTLKRFLIIAVPVGIANIIQPLVNAFIIALLAQAGHANVAAYGIVARVEAFAFVVIMALAIGMGPIIGQNWGARQFDRVNRTLRDAFGFVFLWSMGVAVVLAVFARPVAGLVHKRCGRDQDSRAVFLDRVSDLCVWQHGQWLGLGVQCYGFAEERVPVDHRPATAPDPAAGMDRRASIRCDRRIRGRRRRQRDRGRAGLPCLLAA